jgi:dephospho-CoA kinase
LFHGKPIIGIAGGIGSGKSAVARLFGEEKCLVIDSDAAVKEAYKRPEAVEAVKQWWGPRVVQSDGRVDRAKIAEIIFPDPEARKRLEALIHPLVHQARQTLMQQNAEDAQILAFVWDTPLLFETGLNWQCDAVVFVEAPEELRQERLARDRGWEPGQLAQRENLQWPLDKKREISDYVVVNTADAEYARGQVRQVLSRILARHSP